MKVRCGGAQLLSLAGLLHICHLFRLIQDLVTGGSQGELEIKTRTVTGAAVLDRLLQELKLCGEV